MYRKIFGYTLYFYNIQKNVNHCFYFCYKRPWWYIFSENEPVLESSEAVQKNEEEETKEDIKSDMADESKGEITLDKVKSETMEDIKEETTLDEEDTKEEPKKLRARATATSTSVIR